MTTKNKIARIGLSAAALSIPATALVAVQPAAAVDSCKTQIEVLVSTYLEGQVVEQAFKARKALLAENSRKRAAQIESIKELPISKTWQNRAILATKAEFAAIAAWYDVDFSATTITAGLVDDYVYLGNQTQCPTETDKAVAAGYIATAQTGVQTNLKNFENTAETMVPTYLATLEKAAQKFNNSAIGWKSVKKLVKKVKKATVKLVEQAEGLTAIKTQDEEVTNALKAQLTTAPFSPQP